MVINNHHDDEVFTKSLAWSLMYCQREVFRYNLPSHTHSYSRSWSSSWGWWWWWRWWWCSWWLWCIHHICSRRGRHCLWSKKKDLDNFCSTLQAILHHTKQFWHVEQWHLKCGAIYHRSTVLMTNLWCMLSWCDFHCFDTISILSQLTQNSCLWSKNYKNYYYHHDGIKH